MESLDQHVQRLNTTFAGGLDLDKIYEAAQLVSQDKVTQVLNDLEQKGTDVNNPTAWVTHALRKHAGGGGGGGASGGSAPRTAEDGDKALRKRIGWLNKADGGGFEGAIQYDKVTEAAGGLPYDQVFKVLKDVEGKKGEVREPTAWICSALRKAGGGARPVMQQQMPVQHSWAMASYPAPAQSPGYSQPQQYAAGGGAGGFDDRVRKRVNWLNGTGGFQGALVPDKIKEAAVGMDADKVLKILKDVEENRATVKAPLAYVTSALRKNGGGSSAPGGAPPGIPTYTGGRAAAPAMPDDNVAGADQKLRKRIGWLNNAGGFGGSINYDNVFDAAGGLEFSEVFSVLKQLEDKKTAGEEIREPTAWVCKALRKQGRSGSCQVPVGNPYVAIAPPVHHYQQPSQPRQQAAIQDIPVPMDMDEDTYSKLHKKTTWLNGRGGFAGSLLFDKIVEAAVGLDASTSMSIFKDLETNRATVKNPTSYVTAAMRKARTGGMPGVKKTIDKNRR